MGQLDSARPWHDSRQVTGVDDILQALHAGERPSLVLIAAHLERSELAECLARFEVPVQVCTEMDLWRMSKSNDETDALALMSRPLHGSLPALMQERGVVWLLSDVSYPSNVGTIIRTAEVTGATGIVIDGDFNRPARQRAKRVAMRADRFLSVLWEKSLTTIDAAKSAGRTIIAVESSGTSFPWNVDLTQPVLLIAGGERNGIASSVLAHTDAVVRLPCPGFIPSWNVQAAVAAIAGEHLRQMAMNTAVTPAK